MPFPFFSGGEWKLAVVLHPGLQKKLNMNLSVACVWNLFTQKNIMLVLLPVLLHPGKIFGDLS